MKYNLNLLHEDITKRKTFKMLSKNKVIFGSFRFMIFHFGHNVFLFTFQSLSLKEKR